MITGFEEQTHELTEYELTLINPMVSGLRSKIGESKAVTNNQIEKGMKSNGYKVNAARIRKLIHHIRVNKLVKNLISTSKGYYIAETKEEVEKYVKSLQERINSISEIKKSYEI